MQEYDDSLPLPADVERIFIERAGDDLTARSWLEERGINPNRVGRIALIDYAYIWNAEASRYDFRIYGSEHVGPKRSAFALPVIKSGKFVDLLLIGDDMSYETVCNGTPWLGRENIGGTVRIHAHPMDWLEAGCEGCCHVALISRSALKELRGAESIVCNDIHTALEAWSWGFEAEDTFLSRFEIDDTQEAINAYYAGQIRWHALRVAANVERECAWRA